MNRLFEVLSTYVFCPILGHKPQRKMHATICRRCRIVLKGW